MDDLRLALVMRFVDRFTGPLKRARREIDNTGQDVVRGEERRSRQVAAISAGALGVATAVLGGMTVAAKKAIEFESAMADITKYDLIEDPAEIERLQQDIFDLSTKIPVAAGEIQAIVAQASQADVIDLMLPDAEQRELVVAFAEEVGKIAGAFDSSTDAATEFYIGLMNRANLSLAEASLVADAINHIDNNAAAAASDLMNMMVRVGGIGDMAGLSQVQVAALAAAFRGASSRADIAATAMGNFLQPMTKGEQATDRQAAAFERLGLTAQGVAEAMQVDAEGTIIDVLGRIGTLSDVETPQIIGQLFGDGIEIVGPISNLVGEIEKIPEMFALVKDERQYAGSAAAEFERTLVTTAAQLQLMQNQWDKINIQVGSVLLPHIKRFLEDLDTIIGDIERWYGALQDIIQRTSEIGTAIKETLTSWDAFKAKAGEVLDRVIAKAAEVGTAIREALTFEAPGWLRSLQGLTGNGGGPARTPEGIAAADAAAAAGRARGEQVDALPPPPMRATGGHVRAGQVYEWQEEGLELFAPSVDGRVISNAALRRMERGAASGGRDARVTIGDIHVHAAPGMSPAEVARAVRRELERMTRGGAPLHDGAIYG